MRGLFDNLRFPWSARGNTQGLGVYAISSERLVAACASQRDGQRPSIRIAPVFDGKDARTLLMQWQRANARRAQANVLLNSVDYRIVVLDAPAVPHAERSAAVRWRLKDLIDYSIEHACVDCVEVPGATPGTPGRQVFAVSTQVETVRPWMQTYREAGLSLASIDIPEMALRNLSVLAAGPAAHAFIHLGLKSTRLTLVWQRELCSFRQFDVSAFKLDAADADTRAQLIERLALEVQRSTDSFSRQFHGADLGTVWVSAVRDAEEISRSLAELLPQSVQAFRVEEHVHLDSRQSVVDPERGLDFTFAIGAALRQCAVH